MTLRQKKQYEGQRDQMAAQGFNIDQTKFAIDMVQDQQVFFVADSTIRVPVRHCGVWPPIAYAPRRPRSLGGPRHHLSLCLLQVAVQAMKSAAGTLKVEQKKINLDEVLLLV